MGGKKGDNTKKVAGNARKAEAAASKKAAADAVKARAEDQEWAKGAKSNAKKDQADQKKADLAKKKAEREALLKEEESSLKSAKAGNAKSAVKKSKGLDLSSLEGPSSLGGGKDEKEGTATLNATNIDDALSALTLTSTSGADINSIDRHPERRYPAAFAKYKATRLEELKSEQPGLRRAQREDLVYKEFKKSPENPFNMVSARFDASKSEVREVWEREREGVEKRLAGQ